MLCPSLQSARLLLAVLATATLLLSGCGSDSPPPASTTTTKKPAAATPVQPPPYAADLLHANGVAAVTTGISAGDSTSVMNGISLLEKAALAAPENTPYWIDLADAYANSGLATEQPHAIEIYWMLLADASTNQDAIFTRLAETYARIGNHSAAYAVGAERLKRAAPERVEHAALHFVLLALANNSLAEASAVVVEKSKSLSKPAYLLLLASAIEEASDNPVRASALIDEALKKLDGNSSAHAAATQARKRFPP